MNDKVKANLSKIAITEMLPTKRRLSNEEIGESSCSKYKIDQKKAIMMMRTLTRI